MVIFQRENSIREYFNEAVNTLAETHQEHRMTTKLITEFIHEGGKLAYAKYNSARNCKSIRKVRGLTGRGSRPLARRLTFTPIASDFAKRLNFMLPCNHHNTQLSPQCSETETERVIHVVV